MTSASTWPSDLITCGLWSFALSNDKNDDDDDDDVTASAASVVQYVCVVLLSSVTLHVVTWSDCSFSSKSRDFTSPGSLPQLTSLRSCADATGNALSSTSPEENRKWASLWSDDHSDTVVTMSGESCSDPAWSPVSVCMHSVESSCISWWRWWWWWWWFLDVDSTMSPLHSSSSSSSASLFSSSGNTVLRLRQNTPSATVAVMMVDCPSVIQWRWCRPGDDQRGSDGAEDKQCRYTGNRHRWPFISISVLDPVTLTYILPGQQVSWEPHAWSAVVRGWALTRTRTWLIGELCQWVVLWQRVITRSLVEHRWLQGSRPMSHLSGLSAWRLITSNISDVTRLSVDTRV